MRCPMRARLRRPLARSEITRFFTSLFRAQRTGTREQIHHATLEPLRAYAVAICKVIQRQAQAEGKEESCVAGNAIIAAL